MTDLGGKTKITLGTAAVVAVCFFNWWNADRASNRLSEVSIVKLQTLHDDLAMRSDANALRAQAELDKHTEQFAEFGKSLQKVEGQLESLNENMRVFGDLVRECVTKETFQAFKESWESRLSAMARDVEELRREAREQAARKQPEKQ